MQILRFHIFVTGMVKIKIKKNHKEMRPQELETQICLLFSFYASLIEIQGCYLLLCLLPPQKSERE